MILKTWQVNFLAFILIFVTGFISYSNTFNSPFVFDDLETIVENKLIKSSANTGKIFTAFPSRFVTNFSFAINYQISGLDTVSYHIFNFLVHLLTAFIIFLFVKSLSQAGSFLPLFVSLLFVSHPVQTQAVTYITQRAASLATFFYLVAIYFYVLSRKKKKIIYLILSLLSAAFSLFTKEISYSLPLMIFTLEILFLKKISWKRRFIYILPYILLVAAVYLGIGFITSGTPMERLVFIPDISQEKNISRSQYLLTQINVIITYLRLLLLPVHQNLDYDFPLTNSLWEGTTVFSLLFIIFLLTLATLFYKKERFVSFGIFFFFVALSVESGIVPIADVIFEHRLYLPSLGFFIALVFGFKWLFTKLKIPVYLLFLAISFLVFVNVYLCYQRNKIWQDEETLWMDASLKSPGKARPYYNLGMVYLNRGDLDLAISYFQKSVKVDNLYLRGYNNLGAAFEKKGDLRIAIDNYRKALEIDPFNIFVRNNLATAYYQAGDLEKSRLEFKKVLVLDDQNPNAFNGLGILAGFEQNYDVAINYFEKAIQKDPQYREPLYNLGVVYKIKGEEQKAIDLFKKVIEIDRNDFASWLSLSILYSKKGQFSESDKVLQVARQLNKISAEQYYQLGLDNLKRGAKDLALHAFEMSYALKHSEETKNVLDRLKKN